MVQLQNIVYVDQKEVRYNKYERVVYNERYKRNTTRK